MRATLEQLKIAKKFHIPFSQAHTINLEKAKKYVQYLKSPEARVEQFLDEMDAARNSLVNRKKIEDD